MFAIGRNHPRVAEALKCVLDSDLPNLVQMDVSPLAGVLAERLLRLRALAAKGVFRQFRSGGGRSRRSNSRAPRPAGAGIVHCEHSFHGLTYGALSAVSDEIFRGGFGPLLPGFAEIPFDDLAALERALARPRRRRVLVEPIQGKGVHHALPRLSRDAQTLCRKYGALIVADEIQTGLGRTGRFFAVEHFGVEPDLCWSPKGCRAAMSP